MGSDGTGRSEFRLLGSVTVVVCPTLETGPVLFTGVRPY